MEMFTSKGSTNGQPSTKAKITSKTPTKKKVAKKSKSSSSSTNNGSSNSSNGNNSSGSISKKKKSSWSVKTWLNENPFRTVEQFVWSPESNSWFSSQSGPPPVDRKGGEGEEDRHHYEVDWEMDDPPVGERIGNEPEKEEVNVSKNSLVFVTYNVWFGTRKESMEDLKPRLEKLFELVAKHDPDFICLQEVTYPIHQILQKAKYFQENKYWISDPTLIQDKGRPYGVLMLSKLPVTELYRVTLPSRLGRHALFARLKMNGEHVGVLTSHWESMDENLKDRKKQWQVIYSIMEGDYDQASGGVKKAKKIDHAFIMGDCNFANEQERKELIVKRYEDLWEAKGTGKEDGYTFDPERNRMLKRLVSKERDGLYKRERVDVIISKSKKWVSEEVKLVGTESLKGVSVPVSGGPKGSKEQQQSSLDEIYASDHFGVFGKYVWKG